MCLVRKHIRGLNLQYQFNAVNNITQMIDNVGTHNYSYDTLDRLTSATHPNQPNESYTYDDVGNRTASHQLSSYSYQSFNRLVAANGTSFSFDTNGNQTSKSDTSSTWTYVWDYENRLRQASLAGGVTVTYFYDALGRRVQRTSSTSGTERFGFDGADVVRDLDSANAIVIEYLNGPGIDNKLRQTPSGTAAYFLTDHLGTTRNLADSTGSITSSLQYDSFGNSVSGPAPTRFTYTGRESNADTGLMHYRARWYDPQQGRFTTEDPINLKGGINLYNYVGNEPVNNTDPLGLERLSPNTRTWPSPVVTTPRRASACCDKTWTDCYAQCVENNRFDNLWPLLTSALPKRILPPFRVPYSEQPLTTVPSVIGHYLPARLSPVAKVLRIGGRLASHIATPFLVFEGFYDWGLLVSCAELCYRNPCN
jgi:RHS repeat-associated protein